MLLGRLLIYCLATWARGNTSLPPLLLFLGARAVSLGAWVSVSWSESTSVIMAPAVAISSVVYPLVVTVLPLTAQVPGGGRAAQVYNTDTTCRTFYCLSVRTVCRVREIFGRYKFWEEFCIKQRRRRRPSASSTTAFRASLVQRIHTQAGWN